MVVRGRRIAVDKNHGYAGLGEAQYGAVLFHDWADDEPVDALDERFHETLFLLGTLIAVGQHHLVATAAGFGLDTANKVGEEGIHDVGNNDADRAVSVRLQGAGNSARRVVEIGDRCADSVSSPHVLTGEIPGDAGS